jgi:hypothetical protein
MAAHIGQPTRSRRFIKAYLALWALAASGALGYLATLAYSPAALPPRQHVAEAEPSQAVRAMAKTMKDMQALQGGLVEVKRDVAQLQDAMGQRAEQDKAVQSRLSALEERVATVDASQPPSAPKAKAADKAEKIVRKVPDTITTAHILNAPRPEAAEPPAPKADAKPAPLETGSIEPKGEIRFGEAVVTPAIPKAFAVQLASGPSLAGLRQSWGQLIEKHGGALGALQPRIVPPRSEGGPYRLLAGPIATKADADRICSEMGVGRGGCFATAYTGVPL